MLHLAFSIQVEPSCDIGRIQWPSRRCHSGSRGRLSRNTELVYKRYLDGHAKLTSICLINICQIGVIESYDIMYTRQDCV